MPYDFDMKLAALLIACGILMTSCSSSDTTDAGGGVDAAATQLDAPTYPDALVYPDAVVDPDAAEDAAVTPEDSGVGGMDAAAALLPYGAVCTDSAECETALCDRVEMRNICTARCTNGVCPLPNSTCNNRGVCRPN